MSPGKDGKKKLLPSFSKASRGHVKTFARCGAALGSSTTVLRRAVVSSTVSSDAEHLSCYLMQGKQRVLRKRQSGALAGRPERRDWKRA